MSELARTSLNQLDDRQQRILRVLLDSMSEMVHKGGAEGWGFEDGVSTEEVQEVLSAVDGMLDVYEDDDPDDDPDEDDPVVWDEDGEGLGAYLPRAGERVVGAPEPEYERPFSGWVRKGTP